MSLEYVRNWLRARQWERERRARLLATRPPSRISLRMLLLLLIPLGVVFAYVAERYRQWRAETPYRLAAELGPRVHYKERQRYRLQRPHWANVQGPSVELQSCWQVSWAHQADVREFNAFAAEYPFLVRHVAIAVPGRARFAFPSGLADGLEELGRLADIQSLAVYEDADYHLDGDVWQALEGQAAMRHLKAHELTCTPRVAEVIGSFRQLEVLDLRESRIGRQSLKHLEGLQQLKSLDLSWTKTSDADLASVGKLTSLEELNLFRANVGDDGVKHLAGLKKLRILNLWNTNVGDDGLAALADLPNLEYVSLGKTNVSGRSAEYLAGWRRLRALDLAHTEVDGLCVTRLCQLPRLQWLNLASTPITPDCLDDLHGSESLQEVWIWNAKGIEREATKEFQERFRASRENRRD